MRSPDARTASVSMTVLSSSTYRSRKSYASGATSFVLRTSRLPSASSSLARRAIQDVAVESAGPPCGGLYLKPPSRGGLWLGVMTMPSAWPSSSDAELFQRRMAWLSAGVGT